MRHMARLLKYVSVANRDGEGYICEDKKTTVGKLGKDFPTVVISQ